MTSAIHSTLPPTHPPRHRGLRGRRLLIIEREGSQRVARRERFVQAGAYVDAVDTIRRAQLALARHRWDALVVDERLPDGSGLTDLMLERTVAEPTWVATCRQPNAEAQLHAYSVGGLVLAEPVSAETLQRAVELTLRRADDVRPRAHLRAPLWLNRTHLRIERPSGCVPVTRVEHDLMLALSLRSKRWLPAAELARQVFARDDRAAEILVRQYIHRLRGKLRAIADSLVIEHSRRRGYRLHVQPSPATEGTRD